jgi:hypothetical protein
MFVQQQFPYLQVEFEHLLQFQNVVLKFLVRQQSHHENLHKFFELLNEVVHH